MASWKRVSRLYRTSLPEGPRDVLTLKSVHQLDAVMAHEFRESQSNGFIGVPKPARLDQQVEFVRQLVGQLHLQRLHGGILSFQSTAFPATTALTGRGPRQGNRGPTQQPTVLDVPRLSVTSYKNRREIPNGIDSLSNWIIGSLGDPVQDFNDSMKSLNDSITEG